VSGRPIYSLHHPRWYRERVSTYWWLWRWQYLKFVLRELSSVFVALFVVMTLAQIAALGRGPEEYARFQEWLRSPLVVLANLVSFFFVLFHAITWFNLAPAALVVHVRGRRVPGALIAAANYAGWIAASAAIAWIVLRG
jgi:fumarate reductase subunit C